MRLHFALALLLSLLLTACNLPFGYTDIVEITKNPAAVEGKEFKIKGRVVDVTKLPLVATTIFMVRDESGEIVVFTSCITPGLDQKVALRGRVENMAIFSGNAIGVHLVEVERL